MKHNHPTQQGGNAAGQLLGDGVLVSDDLREVDVHALDLDADVLALLLNLGDELRRVQQALRGDAADIQARAAEGALFDQRRAQARLSRALRTKIAARPAADHDQIKLLHNRTSCRFLQSSMPRRSFEMLFCDICILFLLFYVVF